MSLRHAGYGVFLVACFLVGSAVGVYHDLWPLCRQRGLCASQAMLETPLTRFDGTHALTGLLIGIAAVAAAEWIRRGR